MKKSRSTILRLYQQRANLVVLSNGKLNATSSCKRISFTTISADQLLKDRNKAYKFFKPLNV